MKAAHNNCAKTAAVQTHRFPFRPLTVLQVAMFAVWTIAFVTYLPVGLSLTCPAIRLSMDDCVSTPGLSTRCCVLSRGLVRSIERSGALLSRDEVFVLYLSVV